MPIFWNIFKLVSITLTLLSIAKLIFISWKLLNTVILIKYFNFVLFFEPFHRVFIILFLQAIYDLINLIFIFLKFIFDLNIGSLTKVCFWILIPLPCCLLAEYQFVYHLGVFSEYSKSIKQFIFINLIPLYGLLLFGRSQKIIRRDFFLRIINNCCFLELILSMSDFTAVSRWIHESGLTIYNHNFLSVVVLLFLFIWIQNFWFNFTLLWLLINLLIQFFLLFCFYPFYFFLHHLKPCSSSILNYLSDWHFIRLYYC